ncbi:hypothetical protein KM043_007647 [Ampulex compressa]|nr:hypothetical protein KM043_007647 [Ampulex compressa]
MASGKKFFCSNACGSSFAHRGSLTRHLRYECRQNPRFKCPTCDFRSRWTSDVYRHVRRRHQGSIVRCIDIGVATSLPEAREFSRLSISVRKFYCPNNCGSSFAHSYSMTRHARYECQQEPRFKCPCCEYRSRRTSDVYRHVRRKHEGSVVRSIDVHRKEDT